MREILIQHIHVCTRRVSWKFCFTASACSERARDVSCTSSNGNVHVLVAFRALSRPAWSSVCLSKLVKIYNGNMTQAHLIAQKRKEWQKEPSAEWKKEQLSHSCKADYQKNSGTVRWNAFATLRNVHDTMAHDKPAFERRYGQKIDGLSIPFGTLVESIPITAKDKSGVHQFGKTTLKGIFLGGVPRAGGGWSGDLMTADYADLHESEASGIYVWKRNP